MDYFWWQKKNDIMGRAMSQGQRHPSLRAKALSVFAGINLTYEMMKQMLNMLIETRDLSQLKKFFR